MAEAPRARATACCRVDLGGGTLDIWPLGLLHPGARTVNTAIDVAVAVDLERRPAGYRVESGGEVVEAPDLASLAGRPETSLAATLLAAVEAPPLAARLASASPRGGGLGASSALAVALLAAGEALAGRPPSSPERLAALARDLEARLMGLPTGRQDHFPALLGGALEIHHEAGGERVRRLEVDLARLGASLVVAYTGQGHLSARQNWRIVRRRLDGHPPTVARLAGVAAAAAALPAALETGDFAAAGRLMAEEWGWRRRLAPGIETPAIAALLAAGRRAGAWGGKACGAGGGGCVALLAPPSRRAGVEAALRAAGGQPLAASPTAAPLEVVLA